MEVEPTPVLVAAIAALPGMIMALVALTRGKKANGAARRLGVSYSDMAKRVTDLEAEVARLRAQLVEEERKVRDLTHENLMLRRGDTPRMPYIE